MGNVNRVHEYRELYRKGPDTIHPRRCVCEQAFVGEERVFVECEKVFVAAKVSVGLFPHEFHTLLLQFFTISLQVAYRSYLLENSREYGMNNARIPRRV